MIAISIAAIVGYFTQSESSSDQAILISEPNSKVIAVRYCNNLYFVDVTQTTENKDLRPTSNKGSDLEAKMLSTIQDKHPGQRMHKVPTNGYWVFFTPK